MFAFGNLRVYHVVLEVIVVGYVFSAFKYRVGDYHPIAAVVKVGIGFKHAGFLVYTGQVHGDFVFVVVEQFARCSVCRRTEVFTVRTPLAHIFERFFPRFSVYNRFFSIGGYNCAAQLSYHRSPCNKIIAVAEIETAPCNNIAIAFNNFFGYVHYVFPRFRIIFVGVKTCVAEDFFVQINTKVVQFKGQSVYFAFFP